MRELNEVEIAAVGGAGLGGDIAMGLAIGWASTVAGFAVGSIVPGVGNLAGAAAGFVIGSAAGIGLALARSSPAVHGHGSHEG